MEQMGREKEGQSRAPASTWIKLGTLRQTRQHETFGYLGILGMSLGLKILQPKSEHWAREFYKRHTSW